MVEDEILDLVDKDDIVISQIKRSEYSMLIEKKLGYIRAAELLLQNDRGELWIPKRTAHKRIAPSGLDYSASGHVDSGETYKQALIRETKEEIGLDLKEEDLAFICKKRLDDVAYFQEAYLYKTNTEPNFNTDDFVSARWISPEKLLNELDAGTAAKTSLRGVVEELVKQ